MRIPLSTANAIPMYLKAGGLLGSPEAIELSDESAADADDMTELREDIAPEAEDWEAEEFIEDEADVAAAGVTVADMIRRAVGAQGKVAGESVRARWIVQC